MNKESEIAKTYKKTQIESASPGRLIVLLYEGAIEFINRAERVFEEKPENWIEDFHNYSVRAQNIVTELTVALDIEKGGDIAKNLMRLYEYMTRRLVDANMNKEVEPLAEVKQLLETLLEAWRDVQDTVSAKKIPPKAPSGINLQG